MKYVLMREEREVLEFDVDLSSGFVSDFYPMEGASWAPPGVLDGRGSPEQALARFIRNRRIFPNRDDLPAILRATGAQNSLELAFRSGGFSLFDPYWYRARGSSLTWAQQNFFHNDWDLSFGDAILRGDYDALEKASPVTPDATCSGSSRKAWLRDARGPLLLKAPVDRRGASVVGEVLASRMLERLLPEDEFVSYELVEHDGKTYSSCRPIVGPGEELVPAWRVLSVARDAAKEGESDTQLFDLRLLEEFSSALALQNIAGGQQVIAKREVLDHLAFYRDIHPNNLAAMRTASGAYRTAPFFDFDRAFGLGDDDRVEWACGHRSGLILMVACVFSHLDSSWDYSWYDPHALDGFENEIERMFGACTTLPESFICNVAELFVAQRTYVNDVAGRAYPETGATPPFPEARCDILTRGQLV